MVISLGICSEGEAFASVSSAVGDCDANNLDVTTAGRQHALSLHRLMTHLLEDLLEGKAATKALHSLDENTREMAIKTTARDPRACVLMLILLQQRLSRLL